MTQQKLTTLTPQQEQAAAMLASGRRIGATAKAVGVHRVTVWEWARQPEFRQHLNDLRRAAWCSARDRMRENAVGAAKVLGNILSDPSARAQDRIAAARVVLASAGPLFPDEGSPDRVEARGLSPVRPERDWSEIAMATARRAVELSSQYILVATTPGAAWVESGLADAFPDSFEQVRSLSAKPAEVEAYCHDLLAQWRDALDGEALEKASKTDGG